MGRSPYDLEKLRSMPGLPEPATQGERPTFFGPVEREALAQRLMDAADAIGNAIREIEGLWKLDKQLVEAAEAECDKVVIDGADVSRALSTIAMRLDRAAAVKHAKDD